ncbi:MAG: RluA family pseudouridine synthase [Parachlamydiales bacterium]|nr:RluA family pseudouridine synthase [Parachlamydiales bacterium]
MNQPETIFIIYSEETSERIDKYLSCLFPHSRTYFQFLLENGCVLVNGKIVKKRTLLKKNDEMDIFFLQTIANPIMPEDIPLDILYEDEHLLAINKPANFVVHPAPGNWEHTFVHALLFYVKKNNFTSETLRPGIVHRLDKDTTGVLLAAKTPLAQQKLIDLFAQRALKKTYIALCYGTPQEGEYRAPIGRHPVLRQQMAIHEKGKEAVTEIRVLVNASPFSLVKASPKTGRTHQIRLHLRALGAPILGDTLYGNNTINEKFSMRQQQLHAYSLEFIHPFSQKLLTIKAPIPTLMQNFLQKNFSQDIITLFFS